MGTFHEMFIYDPPFFCLRIRILSINMIVGIADEDKLLFYI